MPAYPSSKDRYDLCARYAVSNGTAALHVAYMSTLTPGDEVIAPAFTFIASVSTVLYSNAKPVARAGG